MDKLWIDLRLAANDVLFYEYSLGTETRDLDSTVTKLDECRQLLRQLNNQVKACTGRRTALIQKHLLNDERLSEDEIEAEKDAINAELDVLKAAHLVKTREAEKLEREIHDFPAKIQRLEKKRNVSEKSLFHLVDSFHYRYSHWVTVMEAGDVTVLRLFKKRRAEITLMFCLGSTVKSWGVRSIRDLAEEIGAGTVGQKELYILENGTFSKIPKERHYHLGFSNVQIEAASGNGNANAQQ